MRSLNEYGVENHKFEVIEECDAELLNERERYWQEHYNVLTYKGLNSQYVNTKNKKRLFSDEMIKNIGYGKKGIPAHNKGIPLSKESIKKRTDKQANVYLNTETFIFYSFKELMILYDKKSTTLRRKINKSKNIIRV